MVYDTFLKLILLYNIQKSPHKLQNIINLFRAADEIKNVM